MQITSMQIILLAFEFSLITHYICRNKVWTVCLQIPCSIFPLGTLYKLFWRHQTKCVCLFSLVPLDIFEALKYP